MEVISLCGQHGCVNPHHHLLGAVQDAEKFGRWGYIGVGDLCLARKLIEAKEASVEVVAEAWQVPKQLLSEALTRCE
jgi:hypothetical protein